MRQAGYKPGPTLNRIMGVRLTMQRSGTIVAGCYVRTADGTYLVQLPAANTYGFSLYDDDQEWPGGFGWDSWTCVPRRHVPAAVRRELDWLLELVQP